MTDNICHCCGQVIPPANPFAGKPVKMRIYDYVTKNPGKTRNEIADYVYADDPEGGPDWTSTISVHIHWMNIRLAKQSLKISASRRNGYRLVSLTEFAPYRSDVVPVTGALVREIKRLYPDVRSHRKLADQLGTSVGTVQRALKGTRVKPLQNGWLHQK